MAQELNPKDLRVTGQAGLKEWSAPETRSELYTDLTIDSWTLGCVMFYLCTGRPPYAPSTASQSPAS